MVRLPAGDTLPSGCLRVLGVLLGAPGRPLPWTFREVADELGLSEFVVRKHLLRLRAWGLVAWEDGKCRTLRATCRFEKWD
jgi:predicted ArsR family transcriptional regulator